MEEGIRQAELRLKDVNAVRHILEKRAYNLFFFLTSLIITFIPLVSALMNSITTLTFLKILDTLKNSKIFSFLPSVALLIGVVVISIILIISMYRVLKLSSYGVLGRPPNTWLGEGVIEGDDNTKGYVLAVILYDYQERIKVSEESGKEKMQSIDHVWKMALYLPFLFFVWSIVIAILSK